MIERKKIGFGPEHRYTPIFIAPMSVPLCCFPDYDKTKPLLTDVYYLNTKARASNSMAVSFDTAHQPSRMSISGLLACSPLATSSTSYLYVCEIILAVLQSQGPHLRE